MKIIGKILFIIIALLSILYPLEKNKYGKYSGDQPIENIKNYPPAIQRLDSIKSLWYKQWNINHKNENYEYYKCPHDFLQAYASAYISSQLYYYDFYPGGILWEYFKHASRIGIEIADQFYAMPNPWRFLMESKGVVLAEVLESRPTTIVGSQSIPLKHPFVIKVRVLDDILGVDRGDTLFIKHNNVMVDTSGVDLDYKLLFSFKSRSYMEVGDTVMQIFAILRIDNMLLDNKNLRGDDFLFVDKDSVIHDPSNVLGIEGKKYIDFKNDLLEFAKDHDIRK